MAYTPLALQGLATELGHALVIKELADATPKWDLSQPHNGATPALLAVCGNHLACLEIIGHAGADLDSPATVGPCAGMSPVHVAVIMPKAADMALRLLKTLVKHGANVNVTTVVTKATPAFLAARANNTPLLQVLVQASADVNLPGPYNVPPVFLAADGGFLAMLEMLKLAGCDFQPRLECEGDGDGELALMAAQRTEVGRPAEDE